jgi:hypothetical protein
VVRHDGRFVMFVETDNLKQTETGRCTDAACLYSYLLSATDPASLKGAICWRSSPSSFISSRFVVMPLDG